MSVVPDLRTDREVLASSEGSPTEWVALGAETEFLRELFAGHWTFAGGHWREAKRMVRFTRTIREPLSNAVRRTVWLVARGASNVQIGHLLGGSQSTICARMASIRRRLGAHESDLIALGPLLPGFGATTRWRLDRIEWDGAVLTHHVPDDVWNALSGAELRVVCMLANGFTRGEIACARRTCVRTVHNQIAAIHQKLRVRCRRELVLCLYAGQGHTADTDLLEAHDRNCGALFGESEVSSNAAALVTRAGVYSAASKEWMHGSGLLTG